MTTLLLISGSARTGATSTAVLRTASAEALATLIASVRAESDARPSREPGRHHDA